MTWLFKNCAQFTQSSDFELSDFFSLNLCPYVSKSEVISLFLRQYLFLFSLINKLLRSRRKKLSAWSKLTWFVRSEEFAKCLCQQDEQRFTTRHRHRTTEPANRSEPNRTTNRRRVFVSTTEGKVHYGNIWTDVLATTDSPTCKGVQQVEHRRWTTMSKVMHLKLSTRPSYPHWPNDQTEYLIRRQY